MRCMHPNLTRVGMEGIIAMQTDSMLQKDQKNEDLSYGGKIFLFSFLAMSVLATCFGAMTVISRNIEARQNEGMEPVVLSAPLLADPFHPAGNLSYK